MHAAKIISRAMEAILAGTVRTFAYKLKFKAFETIFIDHPRVFNIESPF
jgi:hypothetical protein